MRILLFILMTSYGIQASFPVFGQGRSWSTDILKQTFEITNQGDIDVPIKDVYQGCPKRDCIPSIDTPGFTPADQAKGIADDDLILGIEYGGMVRAYPAFVLNNHEIVNDTIAGAPIAITYCPLCGSGVAFRRELIGEPVEFGVSGLLHNSDLILYDRASESLWQQITGEAISGPHRGQSLQAVPLTMTTWQEWRSAHPQTEVLSSDNHRSFNYTDKNPYGDYDESKRLMFPANSSAARLLHPKQVVFGARIPQGAIAVTQRALKEESPIEVELEGTTLTWLLKPDGSVEVRTDTNEVVMTHRMFWFAWYSFHTDTLLRDAED